MKSMILMLAFILIQGFSWSLFSAGSGEPPDGDQSGGGWKNGSRGLCLGFGTSNFVGSASSGGNNKFMPSFSLGFYQDFKIKERVALETGLHFTTKGSRLDAVGELYMHQVIMYLELPLLATWTVHSFEKANIFLAGGPFFGLRLLAFNEVGFPEDIQGFDMGLDLAAGLKFQHVSFRIEGKQGFLNVDQGERPVDYKNMTVALVTGISF